MLTSERTNGDGQLETETLADTMPTSEEVNGADDHSDTDPFNDSMLASEKMNGTDDQSDTDPFNDSMLTSEKVNGTDNQSDTESFVEIDPTGRFGRYDELLGSGAVKKVYRAFDQHEGIDVAWSQVKLANFMNSDPSVIIRLRSEIELLKNLKNENIIVLYDFWKDSKNTTFNFITEAFASGNLREYRNKHRKISVQAIKKWAVQILKGLDYLHTRQPCVIHRDLNCSNIFINGNIGKVKIGDLGLAKVVERSHAAHSLLGTPEYMAPELYEEDYTESVDIYSFGMCLLELATSEIPYTECDSLVQIYTNVTGGIMPKAMNKVGDPDLKAFIERCIGQPRVRPSASELLNDPFLSDAVKYVIDDGY